jgi:hypothetical protein
MVARLDSYLGQSFLRNFKKPHLYISSRSQDGDPKYLWTSRIVCQTLHMSHDSHWERLGIISGHHHTSLPEMQLQTSECLRRDASRVQISSYVRTPWLSFMTKPTQTHRRRMYNQRFRQWNIIENLWMMCRSSCRSTCSSMGVQPEEDLMTRLQ